MPWDRSRFLDPVRVPRRGAVLVLCPRQWRTLSIWRQGLSPWALSGGFPFFFSFCCCGEMRVWTWALFMVLNLSRSFLPAAWSRAW